jgi:lysozyme family protein
VIFTPCLAFTLDQEGGFTDNSADPGGATNQGVTLRSLSAFCNRDCTVDDLMSMPPQTRDAIYHKEYWRPINGDALPPGVDLMTFDFGVNAGPELSAMFLQGIAGVTEDGDIGPVTLAAVKVIAPADLINIMAARQMEHYRALPSYPTFGAGWSARTARRTKAALFMAIGTVGVS